MNGGYTIIKKCLATTTFKRLPHLQSLGPATLTSATSLLAPRSRRRPRGQADSTKSSTLAPVISRRRWAGPPTKVLGNDKVHLRWRQTKTILQRGKSKEISVEICLACRPWSSSLASTAMRLPCSRAASSTSCKSVYEASFPNQKLPHRVTRLLSMRLRLLPGARQERISPAMSSLAAQIPSVLDVTLASREMHRL